MRKGLTFTASSGLKYTYSLPNFNTLLEAQQYLINIAVLIAAEAARGINTGLSAEVTKANTLSVIPGDVAAVFCQSYRGYCQSNKTCGTYTSLWNYGSFKTNGFDLPAGDYYTFDDNTINISENNNDQDFFGNYIGTTQSNPSMNIYTNVSFSCDRHHGTCAVSGWQQNGFLKLMLPCTYYLTDGTLVFGILNITANGTFGWFDSASWQCKPYQADYYASRINQLTYPILRPTPEQPSITPGETTDPIDTETGASDTQDSEDNVGGEGHVTLINNVVNYDNFTPNYSRISTGFITAYEITNGELATLHSFLYSENITDMIKNFFAGDASKAIIDLFNIPVAPNVESTSSVINIGVISSGASANAIQGETVTFDFGSIDITANSYYSNSFMDLSPYNQYSIYLPYIGFRNLSTNDVRSINDDGFKIYLKYVVDVLTGDFVAIVEADHNNCAIDNDTGTVTTAKLTKQLINVYNGSMRTDIPLSYRNPLQGLMPIMSGLASTMFTMATASASGATDMQQLSRGADAGMSVLNNIGNVNNSLMARSDSISGSVGNLSLRTAFIINQECPKYIRTGKSNQFSGYPVYKFMQLNDDRGFVKVRNVIASGFPGTAHEQEMVVSLLKKGVWCK